MASARLSVLLLAGVVAVVSGAAPVTVELRVFSGTENPTFTLRNEEAAELRSLLARESELRREPLRLGYSGFVLDAAVAVYDAFEAEQLLLAAGVASGAVSDAVAEHVRAP